MTAYLNLQDYMPYAWQAVMASKIGSSHSDFVVDSSLLGCDNV